MKHWFVTTDGSLKARWESAFPECIATTPDKMLDQVRSSDVVWLTTMVDNWDELIPTLTAKKAIVVLLSYAPNDREALKALDLGARGYVHTLAAPNVLIQVALVVTNQGVWVGQELLAKVMGSTFKAMQNRQNSESHQHGDYLELLTERERGVALAVVRGATNKEVARQLDITERTVKAHLSAIFKKLSVRDRLQLMLKLTAVAERFSERL
ncbi:response regulator transcription factor [Vreelandella andesensis]|uniref:Response regulator transcription factor n=1 Tax=Vreelandella andesensis TaxID=447567 RepID=A0A3S0W591_9GAMM|nr:response regulator transcription factor [Halomonas andesensis]RUR32026.1 response regulator transcription factor [Halomonas andesensis]